LRTHAGATYDRGIMPHFKLAATRPNADQFRASLALLTFCAPLICLAGAEVYAFTDGDGAIHLSNVPDDARYSMLDLGAASIGAATRLEPAREERAGAQTARPYTAVVKHAAERYGIEAALLHAVIAVESAYNARARSSRGAAGLMQLMPETARRYGVADVYDPAENVRAGALYLRDLLKLFGNDLRLALAAYNAGEAAVIKYGNRIPPYRETAAYVPLVVGNYQKNRLLM
jgi:soluble lytic murein transglycosylase-like protein